MAPMKNFITVVVALVTLIFLISCGGGNLRTSSGSNGSSSGSSSGQSVPGFGEGTGSSGQSSPAKFLYANPLPGGGPFANVIQADGTLSPGQSLLANNNDPQTLAVDPSGSFLFQTALGFNGTQGGIYAYAIDRSSGSLTQATGSPYLTNQAFYSDVVDQQGKYLFAQGSSGIYAFTIASGTGALTPVSGSPFPAPGPTVIFSQPANRIALDQTNRFLYVSGSTGIAAYSINQNTGQLTTISGSPFGASVNNPFAIVVAPSNKFLYETHSANDANLYGYSVDQTTGALTPLAGSPFNRGQCGANVGGANGSPDNMTIASAGKFLYLANCATYSIDPNTGVLVQVSNFIPGDWPVIDPTGNLLWAITSAQNCFHCEIGVSSYQVDPNTGNLTLIPNSFLPLTNSAVGFVGALAITK